MQNLPHPHNDYIRFLYDFGIFGLGWFLIFVATALVALWVRLRQAVRNESQLGISLTLTGLQSLLGVLISMLTDNSGNYIFVMAPLGILIGAALASSEKKTSHAENLDWVFETAEPYLPAAASPLGRADNPAPLY